MKYYLREMQDTINDGSDSSESVEYAINIARKQNQLRRDYLEQLIPLKPRLGSKTFKLISDRSDPLFDSNLMTFSIGDSVRKNIKYGSAWFSTEAMIRLITFEEDAIYTLHYRAVQSTRFELPNKRWYDWSDWREIGCLLAHEIVAKDEEFLTHEFLFTSGATIVIEFKKLGFEKRKVAKGSFKTRHLVENLK